MKPFLLALVTFLLLPASLFPVSLENGYLKLEVDDDSGRVSLSAAGPEGGDPQGGVLEGGERRALLFYDKPPPSFTAIAFASGAAIFGSTEGKFTARPVSSGEEITCEWETDQVRVTQTVTFIGRRDSGAQDGILIRYVVRNLNGRESPAGLCVVFDTFLSEKSGAHFLLSDGRSVSGPLELGGGDMPAFWSADGGRGACLTGALKGSSVTPPDRVLFANYRFIRERLFPPPLGPKAANRAGFSYGLFSRNDSAVALLFEPVLLAAEREYRIIIGLCGEGEFGLATPGPETPVPAQKPEKQAPEKRAFSERPTEGAETQAAAPPPEEGEYPGGELESLERIDELLKDLNRRLEGGPKPVGEEERMRLKERLREIERMKGEKE